MDKTILNRTLNFNGAHPAEAKEAPEVTPPTHLPGTPLAQKETLHWFPPVLGKHLNEEVRQVLERFQELCASRPEDFLYLLWHYVARVLISWRALQEVEAVVSRQIATQWQEKEWEQQQINSEIDRKRQQDATLEEENRAATARFGKAMAKAHLPWIDGEPIGPFFVETALQEASPSDEELAGQYGIVPFAAQRQSRLVTMLSSLFQSVIATAVCGLFVGFCAGSLLGLVSLHDLRNGQNVLPLFLCTLLGGVIIHYLGGVAVLSARSQARAQEQGQAAESGRVVPHLRGRFMPTYRMGRAEIAIIGEILLEAVGLYYIHQQYIEGLRRSGIDDSISLPFAVFALIGMVFSATNLYFKGDKAFDSCATEQRRAWFAHLRREWVDKKRQSPEVEEAFEVGYALAHIATQQTEIAATIQTLQAQRDALNEIKLDTATQARWDEAVEVAAGETARLHRLVAELVETLSMERQGGGGLPSFIQRLVRRPPRGRRNEDA